MNSRGVSLDALLDELSDLAASAPPVDDFYDAVLALLQQVTDARAVALWTVSGRTYRLACESGLARMGIESDLASQRFHESALDELVGSSSPEQSPQAPREPRAERSFQDHIYLFTTCSLRERPFLAMELVFAQESAPDAAFHLKLLNAVAEIVQDFQRSYLLDKFATEHELQRDLDDVLERIYTQRTLEDSAYEIVNETRRFLQCDRVTLLRTRDDHAETVAVSGVETVDKRAKQVRELEQLVATTIQSGAALHFPTSKEELPQRAQALEQYLQSARCESLFVGPIVAKLSDTVPGSRLRNTSKASTEIVAAIVIEDFSPDRNGKHRESRLSLLRPHLELSIQNAVAFADLPLLRLSLRLQHWRSRFRKSFIRIVAYALVPAAIVATAFLIPAPLVIVAQGVVEPQGFRHIYAPLEGEIVQVSATHQSVVRTGDVLVVLRNRQLELRREELTTERSVTLEKLRGIESARLSGRKPGSNEPINRIELSANERELRSVLESLDEQLSIVKDILSSLEVKSPASGTVISWNPQASLEGRPVQQGQKLLSIAELGAGAKLQLRVPDSDIRYVSDAQAKTSDGLPVTFTMATNPSARFTGQVAQVGTIVETLGPSGPTVRVEVAVSSEQLPDARPGGTVVANINCGMSSVGFVWTRRLWDYLRLQGWFG